jgi:imidazolonepropionase-like amidohydrolase
MMNSTWQCPRRFLSNGFLVFFVFTTFLGISIGAVPFLPPGQRPEPPDVHALVGARVVIKPGVTNENATILIRAGRIEGVGPNLAPPPEARIWPMQGMTIYAGFIDPHLCLDAAHLPVQTTMTIPVEVTGGAGFFGVAGEEKDPGNPGPGASLAGITPEHRVARGYLPDAKALDELRELGFAAANLVPGKGIVRGTSAFVLLREGNPNDLILRPDVAQHIAFDPGGGGEDVYPHSLMGAIAATRQALLDAQHHAAIQSLKSPDPAKPPPFNPALDALAPVLGKQMPVFFEPGSALMADRAVRIAGEFGLKFAILSSGQEWRRPELARMAGATFILPVNFPALPKLPELDDWDQVTLDQLRVWDWAPENPALLRREGVSIVFTLNGLVDRKTFRKNLQLAIDRGLSRNDALAALTTIPAALCGLDAQLGTIEKNKIASLTVVEGDYFDPAARLRAVWVGGRVHPMPQLLPMLEMKIGAPGKNAGEQPNNKAADLRAALKQRIAGSPAQFRGPLATPAALLIRHATLWTCSSQGRLLDADLLVIGGRIAAVGKKLTLPSEFVGKGGAEINGAGLHLTPGLIDCHSHSMILGGVNEATLPSTAQVRIGDVVNSETENIFLQLAGGLTTANLLHGSANPIGGQNALIKLRHGAAPEDLKFAGAPAGIKFALGENVKQSNWGEKHTRRFPQSRMGVRTFIQNRFLAARQYQSQWEAFQKNGGAPPRRDLELDAIAEILRGERWIHCHSYRQDEILAFLRLMEDFGVKVGTLQHVLEGYKVADEIARHGAGASCFSDWWAFKFEVYDAIAYAGSLMHQRGALVSFNSDSSDLARRLNLEAAKAVKYGATPEEEALKFVTINPARQLRIDSRVGSIEPGKEADFVLWSKPPLDSGTICLQTWIDGKKFYDREAAPLRAAALLAERAALLAKARKVIGLGGADGVSPAAQADFFREAWEQARSQHFHECLDCNARHGRP